MLGVLSSPKNSVFRGKVAEGIIPTKSRLTLSSCDGSGERASQYESKNSSDDED